MRRDLFGFCTYCYYCHYSDQLGVWCDVRDQAHFHIPLQLLSMSPVQSMASNLRECTTRPKWQKREAQNDYASCCRCPKFRLWYTNWILTRRYSYFVQQCWYKKTCTKWENLWMNIRFNELRYISGFLTNVTQQINHTQKFSQSSQLDQSDVQVRLCTHAQAFLQKNAIKMCVFACLRAPKQSRHISLIINTQFYLPSAIIV